jgi:membrane-associated phospholipid phosphatase
MSHRRLHSTRMVKVGVLLALLIPVFSARPVQSLQLTGTFGVPNGLRMDEFPRSAIRIPLADRESLPGYHLKHIRLVDDLRSDVSYLLGEPDFCVVLGVLASAPCVFNSAFRNESPEFTEMWGASDFADQFFELGDGLGNPVCPLAASAVSLFLGKMQGSSAAESFGRDMLRAQTVNGLITLTLKGAIDRRRPDGSRYGYPSGHTSTAFTAAGVIHHHFGNVWAVPAYLTAAYIGLSRLQENKHYLSDVVGGAILGTYVAQKLTRKKDRGPGLGMSPFLTGRSFGAHLSVRF